MARGRSLVAVHRDQGLPQLGERLPRLNRFAFYLTSIVSVQLLGALGRNRRMLNELGRLAVASTAASIFIWALSHLAFGGT
jgi:hypothetical protein